MSQRLLHPCLSNLGAVGPRRRPRTGAGKRRDLVPRNRGTGRPGTGVQAGQVDTQGARRGQQVGYLRGADERHSSQQLDSQGRRAADGGLDGVADQEYPRQGVAVPLPCKHGSRHNAITRSAKARAVTKPRLVAFPFPRARPAPAPRPTRAAAAPASRALASKNSWRSLSELSRQSPAQAYAPIRLAEPSARCVICSE